MTQGITKTRNRQTDLEGLVQKMMRDVAALAPHPSQPHHPDPLFIDMKYHFVPPRDYDDVNGAKSPLQAEFLGRSLNARKPRHPANQSKRMMKPRGLRQSFQTVNYGRLQQAYLQDLPKRLGLESCISYYMRKLCSLKESTLRYELNIA